MSEVSTFELSLDYLTSADIYLEQVSVAIAESKRVRAADRTKNYDPYEEAQGL